MSEIAANVQAVHQRIRAAAQRAGRNGAEITLVAVTKTHPLETVIAAYQAGLRHFGENRAIEGQEKAIGLKKWLQSAPKTDTSVSSDLKVGSELPTWHLIGHVQHRQVADMLGYFQWVHSVDSLKLVQRIHRLAERDNCPPVEILLQCNVSGEATKSGFELDRWSSDKKQLTAFLEVITHMISFNKVKIRGLMTMAPFFSDPENARPTFQSLAALKESLKVEIPQADWTHLSMGMTDDFEVAIEEGATIIRVGRALFGERNY